LKVVILVTDERIIELLSILEGVLTPEEADKWRAVFLSVEESERAKEAARKEKLRLEHLEYLEYMQWRGYDSQATSTPVHRSEQTGKFSQAARPTLPSLQTQTLGLSCDPGGEVLTPALGVLAQDQAEASAHDQSEASKPRTLMLEERKEGSLSIVARGV
jgi:hypothetical protein